MSDVLTVKNLDVWHAVLDPADPFNQAKVGALVELVALDTPLPVSNILRRSLRLCREALPDIVAEREKLIVKHAKKDADGNPVKTEDGRGIELEDRGAFTVDLLALMAQECPLVGAKTVKVSELGNIKFAGEKLDRLNAFVIDDA